MVAGYILLLFIWRFRSDVGVYLKIAIYFVLVLLPPSVFAALGSVLTLFACLLVPWLLALVGRHGEIFFVELMAQWEGMGT